MRPILLLPILLAACGTGEPGNVTGAEGAQKQAVQTAELTGLYEGSPGERRDQLCVIDRATGNSRFGLVTWAEDGRNCSGVGHAVREGGTLRLTMAGDEECAIEAAIDGGTVTLPQQIPEGCAYYCGPGASLSGVRLEKTGGTAEDAMRATDLVGDPLCAEWPS
jgi:hypothetical protein